MEKETGIDVIKLTEKDYLRTLANGIRFGRAAGTYTRPLLSST
jgi:dynein heavy chain